LLNTLSLNRSNPSKELSNKGMTLKFLLSYGKYSIIFEAELKFTIDEEFAKAYIGIIRVH